MMYDGGMKPIFLILTLMTMPVSAKSPVDIVLDDFHKAAAEADGTRYFNHFAKLGYFIGTDATERWTVAEFRKYADPVFAKGKGWTYHPRDRHLFYAPGGKIAWFDEMLDNKHYGETRGTGILVREDDDWKIAQYHLTVPVPNSLLGEVVKMIRNNKKSKTP